MPSSHQLKSFLIIVIMALGASLSGCNESGRAQCGTSEDCPDDQICRDGACTNTNVDTCTVDADCGEGPYACIGGICRIDDDTDAGDTGGEDTSDTGMEDVPGDDTATDTDDPDTGGPPSVVSVTPADRTTDVPLDQTIEVMFSEPMDITSLNILSIKVENPSNDAIDATVTPIASDTGAELTPSEPLDPATPYEVVLTTNIRDADRNNLPAEHTTRFYTTYSMPSEYETLARDHAPRIYQGMEAPGDWSPEIDIPTRIDFDGNTDTADNSDNARTGGSAPTGAVYYHVTESSQYKFIYYLLYYPARYDSAEDAWFEHDFAGAVFVLDRETDDFLLAEGIKVTAGDDIAIGFKPDSSAVSLRGGAGNQVSLSSFPASSLSDGYPMYVPSGVHSTCNWLDEGQGSRCAHNSGQFPGGDSAGVVLLPGDSGQTYSQATENSTTGYDEMTYELVPLAETLWLHRSNDADGGRFDAPFIYTPAGTNRPAGFDQGSPHSLPRSLRTTGTDSFGRTPFHWFATGTEDNNGQWLLDPAFVLQNRYNFGADAQVDYCYNLFFDIDRTTEASCGSSGS